MSPLPEHEVNRGVLTSELESMAIPNDAGKNNAGEGPQLTRKWARLPGKHEEAAGSSYHKKCPRCGNATAQARNHELQRAAVLTKYGASYRLNRSGSGVFTLNQQTGMTTEVLDKAAGSYFGREVTRPPETRQEYLRQECEQRFCKRKEYKIEKCLHKDTWWISEQALSHHMNQQGGRSWQEPRQHTQDHSTEQHAHQDLVTALTLEPVNNEFMPVTNGGLLTQEIPGQNVLQLENHGQPQEVGDEQDEEEQVASLLGLQEPQNLDTEEAGPGAMVLDAGDVDGMENGFAELVGPKGSEAGSMQGPGSVDALDCGGQSHYEQVDAPTSSRRDTSVTDAQSSHEPSSNNVSGKGVSEPGFQDPSYKILECHEPNRMLLWGGVTSQGQEHIATRSSSPGDQPKEGSSSLGLHSEEPDCEDADMEGQDEQGGVTGVGSDKPISQSHLELAEILKLSPKLQAWVSSQVQEARERERNDAKQRDHHFSQHQAAAWKMKEEFSQQQRNQIFETNYCDLSDTPEWRDTPELLSEKIWKDIDNFMDKAMKRFDSDAMAAAQQHMQDNQDEEDRIAREAAKVALAEINEGRQRLKQRISSHTEAMRQVECFPEEAWPKYGTIPSAQKKAGGIAFQMLRQTTEGETHRVLSVAPGKDKGKARDMSSPSHVTSNLSATLAPPGLHLPLPMIQTQEVRELSTVHCTITAPADPGFSAAANPFEGLAREDIPLESASFLWPSDEDPYHSEKDIQARSGQRPSKAKESEVQQAKVCECEKEQRRAMDLRDGLVIAQRRMQMEATSNAEAQETRLTAFQAEVEAGVESRSIPTQAGSPSESPKSPSQKATGPYMSNDASSTRGRYSGTRMSIDGYHDVQQPGFAPDPPQTDHTILLEQLLDHSHASEETTARIASQLTELSRTVGSIIGCDAAPTADTCPPTSPPAAAPGQLPFCAKQIGAPGTFRPPVRVPVPKSVSINEFHNKCHHVIRELFHGGASDNWPTPPTDDELKRYKASRILTDGPTIDNFRLDFSMRPLRKSVWNQQAAQVFTEVYLASDGLNEEPAMVNEEFLECLKRIYNKYRKFLLTSEEDAPDTEDELESMRRKSCWSSAPTKRQRRRRCALTVRTRAFAQQLH
ncbi:hypothetical protein H4582DRAFT_2071903 [Lactarius indigo]|nr:hypothetical protein H4582DRAFT_2071903 [Lactarius indigo]